MKHHIFLMVSALTLACSSNLILPIQPLANNIKQADNIIFQPKYNLDEVIKRVLNNSPTLKAQRAETFATEGEYKQSRSYVNPEATIEAEDFQGNGIYKGYDSAQTTYGIAQQILVGGKYGAKISASEQGVKLAYNKFEIAKLELIKTTKIAYAEAVSASENLKIAIEQKKLAEQVLANVTKRVNAAAEPIFQKSKAEVTLSNAKIELQKAEREAVIAKNNLAQLWGDNNSDYELSTDNFWKYQDIEKIKPENIEGIIKTSPYFLSLESSLSQAQSTYELEKANAIPDPTLSFGVRQFEQTDNQAYVAGLSIPIPVFDQNRGNIIKAKNQLEQISKSNEANIIDLKNQLLSSIELLEVSYSQIQSFKNEVLPSAEKAFKQTRDGYNAGKFAYLEVLDAQRTLFDARYNYNSALKEYHIHRAEIERFLSN